MKFRLSLLFARLSPLGRYGAIPRFRNREIVLAALFSLFFALAPVGASAKDAVTVLALGDSLTHGYGLPQEDGFVPQLQAWMAENGAPHVAVINGGVSGDTTAGGRARLDWSLTPEVDAVIVELGGNDLLRGIDPASSRENLDAILTTLDERDLPALLTGMRAPLNYGPEWKAEFDAMYPELAEKHGAIYDPFFLEGLEGDATLAQPDGIHPSAKGVEALVARFGPLVLELVRRVENGKAQTAQ